MFKKILIVVCAIMMAVSAFAKDIEVTEGKAKMRNREGKAFVTFNWDNAQWDYRLTIAEQWGNELPTYVSEGEKAFIASFNENAKKMQTTDNEADADITIAIDFTNFDYFFSVMSFVPGHKHKVWADIVVTDNATKEQICKIKVKEFEGGRDTVKFDSFTKMMANLAEEIVKLK